MVQAGSAALDAVQFLVDFVRTIECHVYVCSLGQAVVLIVFQPCFEDSLARLVTRRYEVHVLQLRGIGGHDGIHNVYNSSAGADAYVTSVCSEVLLDGQDGSILFGAFDVN